jgi:hypothetical protein
MQIFLVMSYLVVILFGPFLALALPFGVNLKRALICWFLALLAVGLSFHSTFNVGPQELMIGNTVHYELLRGSLCSGIGLFAFVIFCALAALLTRQFRIDWSVRVMVLVSGGVLSVATYFAANEYLSDEMIVRVVSYVEA